MHVSVAPEGGAESSASTLSLGVSIVLYKMPVVEILPLVCELLAQGTRQIYLVDNSPKGFDAFAGWAPPARVVTISTHQNLGYGRAHNLAIRDSVRRHDYHLVCNPDITLGERTLHTLYELMEGRREVGLCMPRIVDPKGELQYLCKVAPSPLDFVLRRVSPGSWFGRQRAAFEMRTDPTAYEREMSPDFLSGCFMFFRSDVLAKLNGFDDRYWMYLEDLDISRRCKRIAGTLYYPNETITHVHAMGSHKSVRLFLAICRSAIRYFNTFGWFSAPWIRK